MQNTVKKYCKTQKPETKENGFHICLCRSATYHVITSWPLVRCGCRCSACLEQSAVTTSSSRFRWHF